MLAPAEQWKLLDRESDRPGWMEDLADPVELAIKEANGGDWPVTEKQLRRIATSYNKFLDISSEYPFPGMLVDNVIATTSLRGAVHELAHVVIEQGGFAEIKTPGDRLLPHHVAEIVELRYARYLIFVHAARHEASFRRERIRRHTSDLQPELRYEADEYCDPPATEEVDHAIVHYCRRARTTRRRTLRPMHG